MSSVHRPTNTLHGTCGVPPCLFKTKQRVNNDIFQSHCARSHRFRVGDFNVTPSTVDKVPLRKDADLRIVIGETYEAETFALTSFCILLDLSICKQFVERALFFQKWKNNIMRMNYTCAIKSSPKFSKYTLKSCSDVFHGNPSTMRSEHLSLISIRLVLAVEFSGWSSDFRLFSALKTHTISRLSLDVKQNVTSNFTFRENTYVDVVPPAILWRLEPSF